MRVAPSPRGSRRRPSVPTVVPTAVRAATTRERIDQAAYELFSREGVRAVGMDRIVARSGVAKMTLYRHYPTKEKLALAFMRRREELWTRGWLGAGIERQSGAPEERLLAIFDLFDKWFRRADFEGCAFVNVLLETEDRADPVRAASVDHLTNIRTMLQTLAGAANIADPDGFARQWHILMKGSIVAAGEGDRDAAKRAKAVAALLLANAPRSRAA